MSCWKKQATRGLQTTLYSFTLALGSSLGTVGLAAERVVIQFGPLKQSVAIADLETFAETGEVPPNLRLYRPLLTSDVQQMLVNRLAVDAQLGDKVVKDLLRTHTGAKLLESLRTIAPDVSIQQIQTALTQATRRPQGPNVIEILKALPQKTVTVDALSAIALVSQLNFSYLQTQSLSTVLEQQLMVKTSSFQGAFDPADVGNHFVYQRSLVVRDGERDREIPVDLYWSRNAAGPLVVVSHGFGADRKFLAYLAEHLASHGLIVAAIEHPGSNVEALTSLTREAPTLTRWARRKSVSNQSSRILPATEFLDRPKDVTLVLDHLERLSQQSHFLRGRLDTQQVSVIGHSLGGYTALALAGAELDLEALQQYCESQQSISLSPADWLQCAAAELPKPQASLQDERVTQIVLLNPIIGQLFGQKGLQHVQVPTLLLSSTDDPVTPAVPQQLWPFIQIQAEKYLIAAIRATHLSAGDPAHLNPALTQNSLLRERRGEETENLRRLVQGMSLAFVMQQSSEAEQYKPFLTAAYVQSLSTADLPLRFSTDLPANLRQWLQLTVRPQGLANTPLRQLISAIHLEAIGVWNQVAITQDTMLQSLRASRPSPAPVVGVLPFNRSEAR